MCERLTDNMLFRWFVDPSTFAKNRSTCAACPSAGQRDAISTTTAHA